MYSTKHIIAILSMLCATFMMVATSVLPHHHHDDESICLVWDNESNHEEGDDHSHNGCNEDCAMNIDAAQDVSQPTHVSKAWLTPSLSAILAWSNNLLPAPDEKRISVLFYYLLPHDAGIVGVPCGLRAPPSMA